MFHGNQRNQELRCFVYIPEGITWHQARIITRKLSTRQLLVDNLSCLFLCLLVCIFVCFGTVPIEGERMHLERHLE